MQNIAKLFIPLCLAVLCQANELPTDLKLKPWIIKNSSTNPLNRVLVIERDDRTHILTLEFANDRPTGLESYYAIFEFSLRGTLHAQPTVVSIVNPQENSIDISSPRFSNQVTKIDITAYYQKGLSGNNSTQHYYQICLSIC